MAQLPVIEAIRPEIEQVKEARVAPGGVQRLKHPFRIVAGVPLVFGHAFALPPSRPTAHPAPGVVSVLFGGLAAAKENGSPSTPLASSELAPKGGIERQFPHFRGPPGPQAAGERSG